MTLNCLQRGRGRRLVFNLQWQMVQVVVRYKKSGFETVINIMFWSLCTSPGWDLLRAGVASGGGVELCDLFKKISQMIARQLAGICEFSRVSTRKIKKTFSWILLTLAVSFRRGSQILYYRFALTHGSTAAVNLLLGEIPFSFVLSRLSSLRL